MDHEDFIDALADNDPSEYSTPEEYAEAVSEGKFTPRQVEQAMQQWVDVVRIEALRMALNELKRLQSVFLPQMEGKVGEPDREVIKVIEKALRV